MLHRNGKEIEQIFRNGREIALLYKNGVIIYDKRGHAQPNYTITYVNGETSQDITGSLPTNETITGTSYTIPTSNLAWTEHGLLGYSETQYPAYSDIATSVYAPGSTITVDHNMTLYPVWNTTFQGLINEGYVNLNVYPETVTIGVANGMFVKANHYPKELVTDFMDVFNSVSGKQVSTTGVVGEGTIPNAFIFRYNYTESGYQEHWLTDDEWYDLYNNHELSYYPVSKHFCGLDWSNKQSITIKHRAGNGRYCYAQTIFGPKCPKEITYDIGPAQWQYLFKTFGATYAKDAPKMETVHFIANTSGDGKARPWRNQQCINAIFEGASKLKNFDGLVVTDSAANLFCFAFDGCNDIVTIPDSTGTPWVCKTDFTQTFANCNSLVTIQPVLNVSDVTSSSKAFSGTPNLTNLQLYGINANKNVGTASSGYIWNYTWDFTNTKLSQASVNYIVANLTEITIDDPETFEYKTIGFPSTITLTEAQLTRLHNNGWNTYIGGTLVDLTEKTLTYSANGGSNAPAAQTFTISTTVTSSTPTAPEDATFIGWNNVPNATTSKYSAGDTITNTMTLYAVWQYEGMRDIAAVGNNTLGSGGNYLSTTLTFNDLANYLSVGDTCKIKYRLNTSDGEMTILTSTINMIDTNNKEIQGTINGNEALVMSEQTIGNNSFMKLTLANHSFTNRYGYDLVILKVTE